MPINPISGAHSTRTEKQATVGTVNVPPEAFNSFMQQEIAVQTTKEAGTETRTLPAEYADNVFSEDNDRHIETFVRQALAYAPESERKIWARIRDELDI